MSSLNRMGKNAARSHRERAQPASRMRLGELEKKKDYKERSRDYQLKKAALTTLHRKAADKNPDEFYFHMINSETKDGVHFEKREKKDEKETAAQKKILESRDMAYVAHKLDIETKKIEKLRASLHLTDAAGTCNVRTVFVDSDEDDVDETVKHASKLMASSSKPVDSGDYDQVTRAQRASRKAYRELALRIERRAELRVVLDKMTLHANLGKKGKYDSEAVKVKDGDRSSAAVYKWTYVRKR